jgi:hypothetical protein
VNTPGRGKLFLGQIHVGEFFGEGGLLFKEIPCTATIIAANEIQCFYLDKTYYDAFYLTHLKIYYQMNCAILDAVSKRQRFMYARIITMMESARVGLCKKYINSVIHRSPLTTNMEWIQTKFNMQFGMQNFKTGSYIIKTLKSTELNEHLSGYCYVILDGAIQVMLKHKIRCCKLEVFARDFVFFPFASIDGGQELFCYSTCGSTKLIEISKSGLLAIQKSDLFLWYRIHDVMTHYVVLIQKYMNTMMLRLSVEKNISSNIGQEK